jgi:hypothetical protein
MTTIAEIINQFLQSDDRPTAHTLTMTIHFDEEPDKRKFRVSDAGRCRLYRYWKRQGKEQQLQPDINQIKVMEMGNLLHAWLEYVIDFTENLLNAELLVEDTHRKGHADALVELGDKVVLYEFKTIGSKQAWYMLNNGCKAKREHQYQVLSYMDMLHRYHKYDFIDEARILYITRQEMNSKNGDKIPPLHVVADIAADPDLLPKIALDWHTLISAWEDQKQPIANAQDWECRFCPYKDACEFLHI